MKSGDRILKAYGVIISFIFPTFLGFV